MMDLETKDADLSIMPKNEPSKDWAGGKRKLKHKPRSQQNKNNRNQRTSNNRGQ